MRVGYLFLSARYSAMFMQFTTSGVPAVAVSSEL